MALMPWCYAARAALVRLVGRLPVGMGALSDAAALADRGTSVHRHVYRKYLSNGVSIVRIIVFHRVYPSSQRLLRMRA